MEKRRKQALAASFLVGVFAVTAGLAVQGHAWAAQYRRMLDNIYQRALTEPAMVAGELDVALQRVTYVTSPELFFALCAQAYGKTLVAQSALGELPYGNVELEQTTTFLTRTGDYATALARDAHGETVCIEAHRKTLRGLAGAASTLSGALQSLLAELNADTIQPEDMETVQARPSSATESGELPAGSALQTAEVDFPEVPALIYNDPFPDHLSGRTPGMLEGLSQVSEAEARKATATLLKLQKDIFTLSVQGRGQLLAWGFSALVNGGELYVEVTRQGGQVFQVLFSRPVGEASPSTREGRQRATEPLSERGYQDMDPSYSIRQDGILTVHFVSRQDDVYCYSDLAKAGMALDAGDMVSFESGSYPMNHGDRTLLAPAVSEAGAVAQVDGSLTVLAHQLVLIPIGGKYEVLYHEFKCQNASDDHMLVYVGAADDRQERILLLQEDENGALAI